MSPTLIGIKLLVTLATVLGLAAIAERVSTRVASVLAGFPLGTGIVLFFIAWEQGLDYGAAAATATLPGFIAALVLALVYTRLSGQGALFAGAGALAAFLLVAWLLSRVHWSLASALPPALAAALISHWVLSRSPVPVAAGGSPGRGAHLIRALVSAIVVLMVTGLAHFSSAALAGVLAAFPITFFPLLVLLHRQYGSTMARALTRHYPAGLGALITHTLIVAIAYPHWGLGWGTLAGITGAVIWSTLLLGMARGFRDSNVNSC